MSLGYRIDFRKDLPVVIVKIAFPPRLDVEHMFAEMARDILPHLGGADSLTYRITDLSLYNSINIASQVIRGMVNEVRGWAGTSSDPRVYTILVGKGTNIRLLLEKLHSAQYGHWNTLAFETQEEALRQIAKWERGEEARPAARLTVEMGTAVQHTMI